MITANPTRNRRLRRPLLLLLMVILAAAAPVMMNLSQIVHAMTSIYADVRDLITVSPRSPTTAHAEQNTIGDVKGNSNIVTQGQSGGANTVNINPPPKNSGILEAKSDVLFSSGEGAKVVKFEVGQSQTFFIGPNSPYGSIIFPALQESGFKVELVDGKIKFSTQITDDEGNLIATINRNEWQVAPPPRTWDKNYSADAIEVMDPKGRVVLQARVLPDRIQIQGAWPHPKSALARIVLRADPSGSGAQFVFYPKYPTPEYVWPVIRPMFVYPSERHLGELASN
jgi:hypothetical protein